MTPGFRLFECPPSPEPVWWECILATPCHAVVVSFHVHRLVTYRVAGFEITKISSLDYNELRKFARYIQDLGFERRINESVQTTFRGINYWLS